MDGEGLRLAVDVLLLSDVGARRVYLVEAPAKSDRARRVLKR